MQTTMNQMIAPTTMIMPSAMTMLTKPDRTIAIEISALRRKAHGHCRFVLPTTMLKKRNLPNSRIFD